MAQSNCERSVWIAVINGKPDPFHMYHGSSRTKRMIKKYCHLTMHQFLSLGNYIRKASKSEIERYGVN